MSVSSIPPLARARQDLVLPALLAFVQVLALVSFARPTGLPLDDAWIHQVVARTFAETGTLGYARGAHGAAATSYLWAALLAFNFKAVHVSPVKWAFGVNVAASLVTGQGLFALLARDARRGARFVSFGATLVAVTSANVVWFAHSGMEASLFLALSVTAVWAATARASPRAEVRLAALAGIASGLLALTRPESAPLCALLVAWVLYRRRDRGRVAMRVTALTAPVLTAGAIYVGSNLRLTGHAAPATLAGRRWLWFEVTEGLSGTDRALDFVDAWIDRLSAYTFDTSRSATWVMVGLAVYGASRMARDARRELIDDSLSPPPSSPSDRTDGARVLLAWGLLHTVSYALLLPTPGHGGRYQPFVPLLYSACVVLGGAHVASDVARVFWARRAWVPATIGTAAVVPWLVLGGVSTAAFRNAHALAVAHIESTEIGTGRFVDSLPPDDAVASFDIGGIGWATRRPILDAGGLSDPDTAALVAKGRIWEHLKRKGVRFIVLPEGWERALPAVDTFVSRLHLDNPAVKLTRIHEIETPFERWSPAIDATWNAAPRQVVYAIAYTGEAGPIERGLAAPDAKAELRDRARMLTPRDKRLTERSLMVLAAWGLPVSIEAAYASASATMNQEACGIRFGPWGFEVAGCERVADAAILRSMLYEEVGRYLDMNDVGGAARAIPQVVAAARRLGEAAFHPPLAPLMLPEGKPRALTAVSGLAIALGVVVLLLGLEALEARRRRANAEREVAVIATAARIGPFIAVVSLAASCALVTGGCAEAETDLWHAVHRGRGAVEAALARGANPNAHAPGGRTPLFSAADVGDVDIVSMLLAHGASPTVRDSEGASALHQAARAGRAACAVVLSRAGAPLEATAGPRKRTALHDAVIAGSLDTVRALLAARASVAATDSFGETALHLLSRVDVARSSAIGSVLVQAGASPKLTDARGFTALHAAAVTDHLSILADLLDATSLDDSDVLERLGARTPRGETALALALRYGRDRAADLLWRHGAALDSGTALPPLHEAARTDSVPRAAALLAAGADPKRLFEGKSAIDVAREHDSHRTLALLAPKAISFVDGAPKDTERR